MKMHPKVCVSKTLRIFTGKKNATHNFIAFALMEQVSELIWELWFYFCPCLISCHADELLVKGFMWLSGKMTNKVVWCSSSLFSGLITFGFWALSMSESLKQAICIYQSKHLICIWPCELEVKSKIKDIVWI